VSLIQLEVWIYPNYLASSHPFSFPPVLKVSLSRGSLHDPYWCALFILTPRSNVLSSPRNLRSWKVMLWLILFSHGCPDLS
jgi:hypothetical protein